MIPKILHMIWIGPEPFPYEGNLECYKKHHPGWEVKLWKDINLPRLKNQSIYDSIPVYATKADILRIELLCKYGGVYVDVDSYCLKPLDGLIAGKRCFFTTNHKGKIEINLIGCTAGHPTMKALVKGLPKYWKRLIRKKDEYSVYCIYRYIRKRLRGLEHIKVKRSYNCTAEEATNNTYVIQGMDNSWKKEKYFRRLIK